MTSTVLEEILACPALPSLPAVALRVIDLTSDPDVSMDDLAEVIQHDQALAAKVLRTVNSSFYGLREKCATIRKAIVLLGLKPVKSLTLGFSLVSAIDMEAQPAFDYVSYWRRSLFAAVGAKVISEHARLAAPDEAFLAGLFQDIGMIAMVQALGTDYINAVDRAGGDHAGVVREELAAFELQHPEVGAMLAQRWRLPPELVIPIRYHERPTACPIEAGEIVRAVAMGNLAADVMSAADPTPGTRRFYKRGEQWFRLATEDCNAILKTITAGTKELAKLFSVNAGTFRDPAHVLAAAESQLVEIGRDEPRQSFATSKLDSLMTAGCETDSLTGLPARRGFEVAFATLFERAAAQRDVLSLVQIAVDNLPAVVEAAGIIEGDNVVLGAVALMNRHFEPVGGIIARLGGTVFAVIVPALAHAEILRLAEAFRADVERLAPSWITANAPPQRVTVSVGVSSYDTATAGHLSTAGLLLAAGAKAVQAARGAGGNRVLASEHRAAA